MEYLVSIVEWTLVYHPKISVGLRAGTQAAGFSDSERFFLRVLDLKALANRLFG
jgi:hypothetical protein